jgi:hypothetical protein
MQVVRLSLESDIDTAADDEVALAASDKTDRLGWR